MNTFSTKIAIIGINPYVLLPAPVLKELFKQAGKDKGPIPVKGTLNGHAFTQTLVKYSGKWRLYLNTPMRQAAGIGVGDIARVELFFDPAPQTLIMHAELEKALAKNKKAQKAFEQLSPYRQKEIIRYINSLKSEVSVQKNISKALNHLTGKDRFVGRDAGK